MRYFILTLLLLTSTQALAKDDQWLCTEASSIRRGDDIAACGIGHGPDEASARAVAFAQAREEYHRICDLSEECREAPVEANPGRTTCSKDGHGVKCYRMVTFTPQIESKATKQRRKVANALGSAFQALGQSMQQSAHRTSCTSNRIGAMTFTRCN